MFDITLLSLKIIITNVQFLLCNIFSVFSIWVSSQCSLFHYYIDIICSNKKLINKYWGILNYRCFNASTWFSAEVFNFTDRNEMAKSDSDLAVIVLGDTAELLPKNNVFSLSKYNILFI